jgi:hypothetical protein
MTLADFPQWFLLRTVSCSFIYPSFSRYFLFDIPSAFNPIPPFFNISSFGSSPFSYLIPKCHWLIFPCCRSFIPQTPLLPLFSPLLYIFSPLYFHLPFIFPFPYFLYISFFFSIFSSQIALADIPLVGGIFHYVHP